MCLLELDIISDLNESSFGSDMDSAPDLRKALNLLDVRFLICNIRIWAKASLFQFCLAKKLENAQCNYLEFRSWYQKALVRIPALPLTI